MLLILTLKIKRLQQMLALNILKIKQAKHSKAKTENLALKPGAWASISALSDNTHHTIVVCFKIT